MALPYPMRRCLSSTEVTGDDMVAAMDAVGVDDALLVSVFAMYRYDSLHAVACIFPLERPVGSVYYPHSTVRDTIEPRGESTLRTSCE